MKKDTRTKAVLAEQLERALNRESSLSIEIKHLQSENQALQRESDRSIGKAERSDESMISIKFKLGAVREAVDAYLTVLRVKLKPIGKPEPYDCQIF